ncbi:hypothetical protein CVA01_29490 [Corynebacterium variabile]|uniref:Uncharacterized protein n=1 Tax=Corynebacterium variabile TaxID=1727 RepID=A0A4Y4C3M4_9CORY|nr:hypothetical protein CVA01_29490 [Corynebacterium variabile]
MRPLTASAAVDSPFYLKNPAGYCIEVVISLPPVGHYGVKYRDSVWPNGETGRMVEAFKPQQKGHWE